MQQVASQSSAQLHSILESIPIWQDSFEIHDMIETNYLIYQNIAEKLHVEPNLMEVNNRNEERDDQLIEFKSTDQRRLRIRRSHPFDFRK